MIKLIVIIINLIDSLTGFPSQIRNSDLIKHLKFNEKYKFAEERRLFYVALTRSKGKIYLLSKDNQSCFLKEIIKDNKKNITYINKVYGYGVFYNKKIGWGIYDMKRILSD